ncbi:hypothetical protein [Paenibacillus silvisoli]|uniref:hypothetical protein n=1 Tax=Paenibacillus silvisoli TaxID=3110539 RepID=UPI00280569D5|nr:hypothetical protein [Paenibacillus silvisoli]
MKVVYRLFRDQVPVHVIAGGENIYRDWGKWLITDFGTELGTDGFTKLVYKMELYEQVAELRFE